MLLGYVIFLILLSRLTECQSVANVIKNTSRRKHHFSYLTVLIQQILTSGSSFRSSCLSKRRRVLEFKGGMKLDESTEAENLACI